MVYNDRFVTIIGTITMPEANNDSLTGSTEISYPDGYNSENSVVLSIASHNTSHTDWWSTALSSSSPSSNLFGNGDLVVTLKADKIRISSNKSTNSQPRRDVTFKLVLMKLSD